MLQTNFFVLELCKNILKLNYNNVNILSCKFLFSLMILYIFSFIFNYFLVFIFNFFQFLFLTIFQFLYQILFSFYIRYYLVFYFKFFCFYVNYFQFYFYYFLVFILSIFIKNIIVHTYLSSQLYRSTRALYLVFKIISLYILIILAIIRAQELFTFYYRAQIEYHFSYIRAQDLFTQF